MNVTFAGTKARGRASTKRSRHAVAPKVRRKATIVLFFLCSCVVAHLQAQLSYTVTDLGTLGGATSTASGPSGQQGFNAAGMIVGSSTAADNSEHAFLYTDDQMFDLNQLCDLSTRDFKVLTVAKTIDDCCLIVGEGITTNGDKHAFLLTPTSVDGGRWCYSCCQWVWMQEGGGWWWETSCHCYKWHGAPGKHPPPPTKPPHCWWWPLPCPPDSSCTRPLPPPGYYWCCVHGHVALISGEDCQAKGGQRYDSLEEAIKNCRP